MDISVDLISALARYHEKVWISWAQHGDSSELLGRQTMTVLALVSNIREPYSPFRPVAAVFFVNAEVVDVG